MSRGTHHSSEHGTKVGSMKRQRISIHRQKEGGTERQPKSVVIYGHLLVFSLSLTPTSEIRESREGRPSDGLTTQVTGSSIRDSVPGEVFRGRPKTGNSPTTIETS